MHILGKGSVLYNINKRVHTKDGIYAQTCVPSGPVRYKREESHQTHKVGRLVRLAGNGLH